MEKNWEGIEKILKDRKKNNEVQFLVKWFEEDEPVWEYEEDIIDDYALQIKEYQNRKKQVEIAQKKEKEANFAHRQFQSSSGPTFPKQKAPRFTRRDGKIVYLPKKPPIPPIVAVAPPKPIPPNDISWIAEVLKELQGTRLHRTVLQCT